VNKVDLYRILGIKRTASLEQIQAAFRAKAKSAHPDAGGSNEEFEAISRAKRILSDPHLRLTYDNTGEAEAERVDTRRAEALSMIEAMIAKMINDRTPFTSNLVGLMKRDLNGTATQIHNACVSS
jgi:DnaJ-class molecular chaperone